MIVEVCVEPLVAEVDEDAPEVLVVLLDTVVQRADVLLLKEADHLFLIRVIG